jgi:predicted secreted protein
VLTHRISYNVKTQSQSILYVNHLRPNAPERFPVSVATALAIYFVIWWVVLFAVLPFGVRSQEESGAISPGTDPGAPILANLWRKLVWTTIAASVVFGICYVVYVNRLVSLDSLAAWFGLQS